MKKFVSIILMVCVLITIASAVSVAVAVADTARDYVSLEDYVEKNGCVEISYSKMDLHEQIHKFGTFHTWIFLRKLIGLNGHEDVMILDLETGIAAVVYPIMDRPLSNMDKEILRVVIVRWTDM